MSHNVNAIDLDGQEGELMSGVFRWKRSHQLRSLPPIPKRYLNLGSNDGKGNIAVKLDVSKGWMEYFASRTAYDKTGAALGELVDFVQKDLAVIDCLSFPLSVLQALWATDLLDRRNGVDSVQRIDTLHVVCLGCSAKAEERVLRETSCWSELALGLQQWCAQVELYLVGPEMSCTQTNVPQGGVSSNFLPIQMKTHTFNGTAARFFKEHKTLLPLPDPCATNIPSINTVCIGLNCGFGNYENPGLSRYDLLLSWYPDLMFLLSFPLMPLIFTCANDYADLDGECYLHSHFLGSKFLCSPRKNSFSCASTFVSNVNAAVSANNGSEAQEFSCGNSYWYAVQGADMKRKRTFRTSVQGSPFSLKLPVNLNTPLQDRYAFMASMFDGASRKVTVPMENCIVTHRHMWRSATSITSHNSESSTTPLAPPLANASSSDTFTSSSASSISTPKVEPKSSPFIAGVDGEDDFLERLANASLLDDGTADLDIVTSISPSAASKLVSELQLKPVANDSSLQEESPVSQVLNVAAGILVVAFIVPAGVLPSDIAAHIDDTGNILMLEIPKSKSRVELVHTVVPASVRAKTSKKKGMLTLTAKLAVK
jgi:hypothetical protein